MKTYRKGSASYTPISNLTKEGFAFDPTQPVRSTNPLPVKLVEGDGELTRSERPTDANPLGIVEVPNAPDFKPGLPISPMNPWPVQFVDGTDLAYNASKPVSAENPLPVRFVAVE
jgi:hypothetical protein